MFDSSVIEQTAVQTAIIIPPGVQLCFVTVAAQMTDFVAAFFQKLQAISLESCKNPFQEKSQGLCCVMKFKQ